LADKLKGTSESSLLITSIFDSGRQVGEQATMFLLRSLLQRTWSSIIPDHHNLRQVIPPYLEIFNLEQKSDRIILHTEGVTATSAELLYLADGDGIAFQEKVIEGVRLWFES